MPTERQNSLDYNIFFKTSSSIIAFNKSYRDNSFKVIILSQEPWVFIGRLFKVRFSVTINEQKSKQAKMGGGLERSEKGCVRGQGESPCFPLDSPSPPLPCNISWLLLNSIPYHPYIVIILIIFFFFQGRRAYILLHFQHPPS